ncbi:MAG: glycosyltransferase family 2 protein [Acidimicrobiia bacterium]
MATVSVIVPTFNRRARLERVLAALGTQTFPLDQLEVIVVSDGSTDGSVEWLSTQSFPFAFEVVEQANAGPAAARNNGVAHSSAPLILFIDDDVVAEPGLVAAHCQAHDRHGDHAIVIGPMLTPDEEPLLPWVRWEQTMLYKQYRDMTQGRWHPTARQFYTGNASLPRRAFDDVRGFDTSFRRAEDVELAYRLADRGYHFEFEPEARARHYAERSFQSWLSIASAYGHNDAIMGRDRGQDWLLDATSREFHNANPLTRITVRATIDRPRSTRAAHVMFTTASNLAEHLRLRPVSRYALSGLYNLIYYHAFIDELGSADLLLRR